MLRVNCYARVVMCCATGQGLPPAQRRQALSPSTPVQPPPLYPPLDPLSPQARVMEDQKKFVSVPATTVIPLAQQTAAAVAAEVEAPGQHKEE